MHSSAETANILGLEENVTTAFDINEGAFNAPPDASVQQGQNFDNNYLSFLGGWPASITTVPSLETQPGLVALGYGDAALPVPSVGVLPNLRESEPSYVPLQLALSQWPSDITSSRPSENANRDGHVFDLELPTHLGFSVNTGVNGPSQDMLLETFFGVDDSQERGLESTGEPTVLDGDAECSILFPEPASSMQAHPSQPSFVFETETIQAQPPAFDVPVDIDWFLDPPGQDMTQAQDTIAPEIQPTIMTSGQPQELELVIRGPSPIGVAHNPPTVRGSQSQSDRSKERQSRQSKAPHPRGGEIIFFADMGRVQKTNRKGQRVRGPYTNERKKNETHETRLVGACVRCRMQRIRVSAELDFPQIHIQDYNIDHVSISGSALQQHRTFGNPARLVPAFPAPLSASCLAFATTFPTLASSTKELIPNSAGASDGTHGILSKSLRGRRKNLGQSLSPKTCWAVQHSRFAAVSSSRSLGMRSLGPGNGMARRCITTADRTPWPTCKRLARRLKGSWLAISAGASCTTSWSKTTRCSASLTPWLTPLCSGRTTFPR